MAGNLFFSIDFGASPQTDTAGARPYTGTNPFWNSFSLWLDGGPSQTQTKVGTATTIKARVSNASKNVSIEDVNVDVYVMNPHVGLGSPNLAIQRLKGFASAVAPGSGSTSASDAHVVTCRIQDPNLGPIPWTPTQTELNNTVDGKGHLCLIANVYADGDGAPLPDAQPFDVVNDAHQGQRNITLLAASSMRRRIMQFQLMPDWTGAETTVRLEHIDLQAGLGAGERWLLRSHRQVVLDREREELVVVHEGKHFPIVMSQKQVRGRIAVKEIGELDREGRVPAFKDPLPAEVVFEEGATEIGSLQVFEIVQRDQKGEALGALRFLSLVTG
jgi:hypothetical protein